MHVYALSSNLEVALTLLLIADHDRWQHRLEYVPPHLPKVSSPILVAMGLGFIASVF